MRKTMIPELLAPAGSKEALRAALGAGADAVYLGVQQFNARRNANNFELGTLRETCDYVHLNGKKIYLTLNTVILPQEMEEALETAKAAWLAGVDAFIIQDIGLVHQIRKCLPEAEIHASTQMNIHDSLGVLAAKEAGISRVTLSRELSLAEMSELAALGVELEVFTHGALCVCYSGRCLLSSLVGKRSANRGLCAQPCRLPYDLVSSDGQKKDLGGKYPLSTKDLCSLPLLKELCETGVASLKIEGRMKSAEYVATVVSVYRAALDRLEENPDIFSVSQIEIDALTEAFSRGFTQAYLTGDRYADMMSIKRPNNWGVPVGRVKSVRGNRATITLSSDLNEGDTLEFLTSRGSFVEVAREMTLGRTPVSFASAKEEVTLEVTGALSPTDRVVRVHNAALADQAQRITAPEEGLAQELSCTVKAILGEPLEITFTNARGGVTYTGSAKGLVVELARTRAVSAEDIKEHIARLGGTPYSIGKWSLELSDGIGLGFSQLHALRRDALLSLEESILASWHNRELSQKTARVVLPAKEEGLSEQEQNTATLPLFAANARTAQTAIACLESGATYVYMDIFDIAHELHENAFESIPTGIVPLLPGVLHDNSTQDAFLLLESFDRCLVGAVGQIPLAKKYCAHIEADASIPVLNGASIEFLESLGVERIWLSPEVSHGTLKALAPVANNVSLGLTVYGKQEMMVTEHCVFSSIGECSRKCRTCPRNNSGYMLKDRRGFTFPLYTDDFGRSHLFNPVTLDLVPSVADICQSGVNALRVDATLLSHAEASCTLKRLMGAYEDIPYGIVTQKEEGSTTGNFYRGIM